MLLSWYDYRIHRGICQVARDAGWNLACPRDTPAQQAMAKAWWGDGCIALSTSAQNASMLTAMHARDLPIVDMGLVKHHYASCRLVVDNWEIGRLAADHFLDRGYREVFVNDPGKNLMFKERRRALQHFMKLKGGSVLVIRKQPKRTQQDLLAYLRDLSAKRGQRLEEISVGIFGYHDDEAAQMISLLMAHGLRIPENVAVLGVDNDEVINEGLSIGLSSVDSDLEGLGQAAAMQLREMLDRPAKHRKGVILRHPPKGIISRRSTDYYAVQNLLLSRALRYIHDHYANDIQAGDVAKAVGVTQQSLQKTFAKNHVRTPAQEIRYQRVQAVVHGLEYTDAGLAELAKTCGFYSVDGLIRNFRQIYGITPGKYRQRLTASPYPAGKNQP